jgi:hypothetical protein
MRSQAGAWEREGKIGSLDNEYLGIGTYEVKLASASYSLSSGIYIIRMKSGDFIESRRMVLAK